MFRQCYQCVCRFGMHEIQCTSIQITQRLHSSLLRIHQLKKYLPVTNVLPFHYRHE